MENEEFIALLKFYGIYQPEDKYKIVCPFHGDKNASLQINVDKGYFYCYGCECKGGYLELYKEFYKLKNGKYPSDLVAYSGVARILRKKGIKIEQGKNVVQEKKIVGNLESLNEARNFYYNLPSANWYRPSNNPANYEETVLCRSYMKNRGFTNSLLSKCGAKPSLNKFYPIVLPLLENGIFRGYVMRTFDPDVEANRKYMYNRGFRRQNTLPGNYRGYETIICVEGYLDCLKAQQFGIKNVVAFLGWKISGMQIEKLRKAKVKNIICALDNDESGRKGYKYLKAISKLNNFNVTRLHYPKGIKDFGDLMKGTDELGYVLDQIKKINSLFTRT